MTPTQIHRELSTRLLFEVGGTPIFRTALLLAIRKVRSTGYTTEEAAAFAESEHAVDASELIPHIKTYT